MDIKCPHCGTEYEVGGKELYRYAKCEVCGKGFVIGQSATEQKARDATQENQLTEGVSATADKVKVHKASAIDNSRRQLIVDGAGGWFNFKTNLLLWFRICFRHWKLMQVACPQCKSETVVCAPQVGPCEFKCDSCGKIQTVIEGVTQHNKNYEAQRQVCHDVQTRYKKELSSVCSQQKTVHAQLQICELRNCFFEQVSIFECDWDAYNDEILPKRLQFIVDGLRAKIANAHSSIVANTVAHAEATNQAYGTTVGLRDPNSGLYLIARDIVQAGGWNKIVAAEKEHRLLSGSIEEMNSSLSHYEALMLYYYDLCAEFRGKNLETARRDRLRARCGYPDESSLPVLDGDKSETLLLKEKAKLEKQKLRIQQEVVRQIGYIESDFTRSLIGESVFKLWTCAMGVIVPVLILLGYAGYEIFADKVSLSGMCRIDQCVLTRDLLAKAIVSPPNLLGLYGYVSEPDVLLSKPHKFSLESELPAWFKPGHDSKVSVAQVFHGKGVIIEANCDKHARAFVKSTHKYSLGETIRPGIYVPCGKARFRNDADNKTTLIAFLQMDPETAELKLQQLISELDGEADKRIKAGEEAERLAVIREAAKLDYEAEIARSKAAAEAEDARRRSEEESARLMSEKERRKIEEAERELESRKETCEVCKGGGTVECIKCRGKDEIIVLDTVPCPTCSTDHGEFVSPHRRGYVRKKSYAANVGERETSQ